eukprot:snap_masked-scaffold_5-processed-gene-11.9-mRNA-1 protein AED:1.00 eAED:1.00 QI:0/0/0/0/1/1/2/0/92
MVFYELDKTMHVKFNRNHEKVAIFIERVKTVADETEFYVEDRFHVSFFKRYMAKSSKFKKEEYPYFYSRYDECSKKFIKKTRGKTCFQNLAK